MMKGVAAVMSTIVVLCCVSSTSGEVYFVGDSSGWTTGVDYSNWTGSKAFEIGDVLVFNYASGSHTVDEVSSADHDSCTTSMHLSSDNSGSTNITLSTAGTHFFICGVHCSSGMKLSVTVGAASGSEPSAPGAGTTPDIMPISPTAAPPPPTDRSSTPYLSPPVTILLGAAVLLKPYLAPIL